MREKPPFSGTVKEYTRERYIGYVQGNISLDYKIIFKFDENNKLNEIHSYNAKNKLTDISYYLYDNFKNLAEVIIKTAKGNKKQQIIYEYSDNKSYQVTNILKGQRIITKYDEFGNPIEEIFDVDSSKPPNIMKFINKYDDKQQLIEKQTLLPSGEIDSTVKYKYNTRGLLIEECQTNEKTSWIVNGREFRLWKSHISQFFYNNNKDVILTEFYTDGNNDETHKKEITYDEFNSITEIKDFRKGYAFKNKDTFGLVSVTKYSYVR